MFSVLLAARTSWIGILAILGVIAIVWLVIRASLDFARWFKEEIVDDFRQRKARRKRSKDSKR